MPVRALVSLVGSSRVALFAVAALAGSLVLAIGGSDELAAAQPKTRAEITPSKDALPAGTPDIAPIRPSAEMVPMRVVLVKDSTSDCKTDCSEWISAEGDILPATTDEFRRVLGALGDRKLPVFISSRGGNATASLAIGRMLRERHLSVSVTHTVFSGCAPSDQTCSKSAAFAGYRGKPVSTGTICASACVMVLAGGEKRYAAPDSKVGVHQASMILVENISTYKFVKYDISDSIFQIERELVTERLVPRDRQRIGNDARIYREQIAPYFTEMGIPETLVTLMLQTDAASVHWMTAAELADTHLVTNAEPGENLLASPAPGPAADAPKPTAAAKPGHVASLDLGPDAFRRSE